ncbi:hypothetical protein ATCC90586_008891 [Pythium insidiosum]|nr:hypothetical protein ATCC90586_008891 [Pythium insidiosum]
MQTPRDADGGEPTAVASLVARLRLRRRCAPPLAAAEAPQRHAKRDDALLWALPAGQSASSSATRRRHGLDAFVRMLCRRFAGRLVVRGKLLNHEELLVRQVARLPLDEPARHRDGEVVQLPDAAAMRFVVHCGDAPESCIGQENVSAVVVAPTLPRQTTTRGVHASHSAALQSKTRSRIDALWSASGVRSLEAAGQVFGFDVSAFLAVLDRRIPADEEEDEDVERSANERIERHPAFTDLRGVQSMMRRSGLDARQWLSMAETPRDAELRDGNAKWSYSALAAAQKTRWSNDRVARGDELAKSGQKKQALVEFTGAIKLDDGNAVAWARRGRLHLELRQYEDAIRDLERVVQINSGDTESVESLLRAKSKLSHSKHVVTSVTAMAPTAETIKSVDPAGQVSSKSKLEALETDRLRRLLEEEEDARRRKKPAATATWSLVTNEIAFPLSLSLSLSLSQSVSVQRASWA